MLFGDSTHQEEGGVDTLAKGEGAQEFSPSLMRMPSTTPITAMPMPSTTPITAMRMPSIKPITAQVPLVSMPVDSAMMPGTALSDTMKSARIPVYVPGSGSKSSGMRPPRTRRAAVVNVGVMVLLVAILTGTLIAVLPAGPGQASGLAKFFNPTSNIVTSKTNSTALIAAQAATATAVTQDGYDAGNQTYTGVQTGPTYIASQDASNLNRFFYGQCTYWANMRYHELTGYWVPWLGNAGDWAGQAPIYHWQTSAYPNPNGPSIIVLAPYTQGAGSYGHVAVVETGVSAASAAANGVWTSNWNWNGDWAKEDWWPFHPGKGVTFVWY